MLRTEMSGGPSRLPSEQLLGREREREAVGRLLEAARSGHAGGLVVRGEPGVGKTALLEYAVEAGRDFRAARTFGVEAAMELPFAAVRTLGSPFCGRVGRLPPPPRERRRGACGSQARP